MAKANIPAKGAIVQRDFETYSLAPHIPGGFTSPAFLRKIADVAESYGAKFVKLYGHPEDDHRRYTGRGHRCGMG